jgi:hypothetical protein
MNSFEATWIFELPPDWDRKGPDSCPRNADDRLDVSVLCTKMPATANELEVAAELARGLHARIHLLVAREVSYAVPLESSPVLVEFQEAHLRKIAEAYGGDIRVDVLLCRNAEEAFVQNLLPHSLVVVGTRKRWWPTREERLAQRLQNSGHAVLLIDRKAKTNA